MSDRTISLRVLTDSGLAIEDEAVSVRAPGEKGAFGILKNHAPLITTLVPGTLLWRKASGETYQARIGAGLLEVVKNRVTVLTSSLTTAWAGSGPAGMHERRSTTVP